MDDFRYLFFYPMDSLAEMDHMSRDMNQVKEQWKGWQELNERWYPTFETYRFEIIRSRSSLYYVPESQSKRPEEEHFILWDYFYTRPETSRESRKLFQTFISFLEEINFPEEFRWMSGYFGYDRQLTIGCWQAKDRIELSRLYQETWEKLGEKGEDWNQEVSKLLWKREQKTGWYRADLSLIRSDSQR
jgi:hypothetical protein